MTAAYTLTNKEYAALKGRLTKAINSKDNDKIIKEVDRAFAIFDAKGYPDDWGRWERAKDDAAFAKVRAGRDKIWG